jgi:hypothetical protein
MGYIICNDLDLWSPQILLSYIWFKMNTRAKYYLIYLNYLNASTNLKKERGRLLNPCELSNGVSRRIWSNNHNWKAADLRSKDEAAIRRTHLGLERAMLLQNCPSRLAISWASKLKKKRSYVLALMIFWWFQKVGFKTILFCKNQTCK